jgi:4-amino-4-deoxy-L-arabinose transferase-like glycosyltransferase
VTIATDRTSDVASPGARLLTVALRIVDRHPVRATLGLAVAVAAVHVWWILAHRQVGAFDVDEAGYLADALRFRRALFGGGGDALVTELRYSGTAPLVPLLSVPLLALGGADPRAAMLVQPAFLVVATVCICALALRLVPPRAAVAAAAAFLAFPTTILAVQSYWFGLGVTAAMCSALLFAITSDRGHNRRIWWFGLAVAAMVLMRTMALAFLPAVIGAAVLAIGRDRRGLFRLGLSLVVAAAIAAPWFLATRHTVFRYLFEYGYGDHASSFGASNALVRVFQSPLDLVLGMGIILPAVVALSGMFCLASSLRRGGLVVVLHDRTRAPLLWCAVIGLVTLMSSANLGGWFTLPLLSAIVPLGADATIRGPIPLRRAALGLVATSGTLLLLTSWWILPYARPLPVPALHELTFTEYDPRFSSDRRAEHDEAAEEWRSLNEEVADFLLTLRRDTGAVPTVSGNTVPFNTNSLALAGELNGFHVDPRVPDTLSESGRERGLSPHDWNRDGELVERVLVIARHPHILFTPDLEVAIFDDAARKDGWRVAERFPMPGEAGGTVMILRRP